jgi:hypothetical protein
MKFAGKQEKVSASEKSAVNKKDSQFKYNVTLRRLSVTIVAVKKAISITYSACV